MIAKGKKIYIGALIVFAALSLSFRPGIWLVNKPPSNADAFYVTGWQDGCISGTNSYSLLFAPLLDQPFVKDINVGGGKDESTAAPKDKEKAAQAAKEASAHKDAYKGAWNEGFTLCRFYQSSVYELMQFGLIIITLLYIGYQLSRRKN